MTKEEILALITGKIAGQGNQVDTGGALPAILEGIIGLIPEPTPPTPPTPSEILDAVTVTSSKAYANIQLSSGLTKGAACEVLGISSADLDALMAGDVLRIKLADYILSLSNAKADGSRVQFVAYINATTIESDDVTTVNGLQIDYDSAEGTYQIDHIV